MFDRMAARVAAQSADWPPEGSKDLLTPGGWEDHKVAEPADVLPEPIDNVGGVEMFCVIDVLEGILGPDADPMIPYEETGKAVQAWADAHGAITYAEPRDSYDLGEAAQQALDAGKTRAVVDDLS